MEENRELEYLAALFDDPDEVVSQCVDRRIIQIGPSVIPELQQMRHKEQNLEAKRTLSARIFRYNAEFRIAELHSLAERENATPYSIFEGGFLIASMLNPQITRNGFEEAFFECAYEFRNEISEQRTAVENIGLFNHIFFHRLRFTLCDQQVTTEKNAMLYDTLRSRRGNPFVIATLYMMFAEEVGLPLYPLCFHGGFVPTYVEKGRELFYVNIYQNGEIFHENQLRNYMMEQGMNMDNLRFLIRRCSVLLNIYLESLIYLYTSLKVPVLSDIIQKALAALGGERFLAIDDRQDE